MREPWYADPDEALLGAAAGWRAAVDPAGLRSIVASIPGPRSRIHAPEAMDRTDVVILDAWRRAGWRVGRQRLRFASVWGVRDDGGRRVAGLPVPHRYRGLEGANLVALAEGRTDEAIVLVAHHDSVRGSPGADDNAAAVAVLLELAARLDGRRFRRTVILATPDLEEIGLIGSRSLVRWLRGRYRVVGAVVLDPVGFMNRSPGAVEIPATLARLYPEQTARIRAAGLRGDSLVTIYRRRSSRLAAAWARCLAATIGRDRVVLLRDPRDVRFVGGALNVVPLVRNFSRSDHVRFWNAGMPAIHVTDTANFRNPHYHRPTDTPDTLDYETLAEVTAAAGLLVERLAA